MKISNPFFKKKNNITLSDICSCVDAEFSQNLKKIIVNDISPLDDASSNDISFFHSTKYLDILKKTNSKYVITNFKYSSLIPKKIMVIKVKNILLSVAKITELFYPKSLNDCFDEKVALLNKNNNFKNLKFGKNVLIGKNVTIGKNCSIGHNSIIESNVKIGNNCSIGSNVMLKKTLIGNNVNILDGAIVGKKGFGFFPLRNSNYRYPHVGMVILGNNVEIGCNNTIDRGSLSNTTIGDNTFLDNQVHVAHNVKIGKNCIITGQVGFAGSSIIGDKVMIGGQAGVSGHLKIGNNVHIGGGSGVIKNIPDNTKVMGYPAKNIRNFLKENK
tara:strand:- start:193 stop:1179 length:987 start_codon:yes stop_codon:yes gene_type:complete